MNFRHVPLALFLLMLLPGAALARKPAHGEAAAFFARHDAELEFRGGDVTTLSFGRYGIEYREDVVRFLQMSIAFGYSENDADHPAALAREYESLSGIFGGLGVHLRVPFASRFTLESDAWYLLQRDSRERSNTELTARLDERRGTLGLAARFGIVEIAAGGGWRDFNYSETVQPASGAETVRHADPREKSYEWARVALLPDRDSRVELHLSDGADEGWSLRYVRAF